MGISRAYTVKKTFGLNYLFEACRKRCNLKYIESLIIILNLNNRYLHIVLCLGWYTHIHSEEATYAKHLFYM